jgi:solute:Na+ symporter, SSS family
VITKLVPGLSDRAKLWVVRLTVLVLTIVAFLISFMSETIKDLVETASAFGSAGVFVAALFALFTRFGGPLSAYASVTAGVLVWAGGKYGLGLPTPYLAGLVAALAAYVGAALLEKTALARP